MAESVYETFKNKPFLAREAADRRSAEVWEKDSRIEEIDKELSGTGLRIFAAALSDEDKRDAEFLRLETRLHALKEEKRSRLKALGYPEDYTEVKYECTKCSDSGYVGIKMCDCMRRALIKQNYARSGIGKYLENQTFDNFDLGLYSPEHRLNMTKVFNCTKKYAEDFNETTSVSLIFMGGTGLGKTHLSSAIAKAVIDKGFSVIYDSAQNIISTFERERFSREGETRSGDRYMNTDLLIIDDLGTEIYSKSSVSYFYSLVNTRLISSKPTIISTNLNPQGLYDQYEARIVSRILGEFKAFHFTGSDLRKNKKL